MKILITGAGGFLGRYVAQQLSDHNVDACDRAQLNLANADAVKQYFADRSYDAVVHCAAAGRNTVWSQDPAVINNNLACAINLMTHRHKFGKLINIGTGAEFDLSQHIDSANEDEIFDRSPKHSYGCSKNLIARYLRSQPNCVTLRLFGCFDSTEDSRRLLQQFHSTVVQGQRFDLEDRWFDMFSARDFVKVLTAVLNNTVQHQDINCVYAQKHRLSDILSVYCDSHNLDSSLINVTGTGLNYTGDSGTLDQYNLDLDGLEKSLELYEFKRK